MNAAGRDASASRPRFDQRSRLEEAACLILVFQTEGVLSEHLILLERTAQKPGQQFPIAQLDRRECIARIADFASV